MATHINVVTDSALLQRAKDQQAAGRLAFLEGQQRKNVSADIKAKQATTEDRKADKGLPLSTYQRDPAAHRHPASKFAYWISGWAAPSNTGQSVWDPINNRWFLYRYIDAKPALFYGASSSGAASPQNLGIQHDSDVYDASQGTAADHGGRNYIIRTRGFGGISTVGQSFFFTEAPVMASTDRALFGVQRHSWGIIGPNWQATTIQVSGGPVNFYYHYIFFRHDLSSGKTQIKSVVKTQAYPSVTAYDHAAYVEGGSQWVDAYMANAFSDDPSTNVRALGYYGEYHVRGSKAWSLRLNGIGSISYNLLTSQAVARALWGRASELQWLAFDVSYTDATSLKIALEANDVVTVPTGSVKRVPALSLPHQDQYNTGSQAAISPYLQSSYWNPTGPYLYPLISPPRS